MTDLLKASDVAEALQISRTAAYDWIAAGHIPVIRVSAHTVRVHPADLQAWVDARRAEGRADIDRGQLVTDIVEAGRRRRQA